MLGLAGVALSACGGDTSPGSSSTSTSAVAADLKSVATDAWVYGYPLVLMDATRKAAAPTNHFFHADVLPDAANHQVVRPNRDTLYSQAWVDARTEPVVLQVPAMEPDRFWLMPFLDMWTNVGQDPSSVRPQPAAGQAAPPFTYAITAPGWTGSLPAGATPLPMPTSTSWLLGRIQTRGPQDFSRVHDLQQQLTLTPLSQWRAGANLRQSGVAPANANADPQKEVTDLDARTFFNRLCALMVDYPGPEADAPALARFAAVGIKPGATVDNLPVDVLEAAAAEAKRQIPVWNADPGLKNLNGWNFYTDVGTYGTNYMMRAHTAWRGLGANLPKDAVYPTVSIPGDATTPTRNYRIRFAAGQLPPATAFWSITAYGDDSFLVPNPAGIYSVGNEKPVTPNPDGSLDIAVQHADPGPAVPPGNWLPIAPNGPFSLTLRLYGPKPEVLDGTWEPPLVRAS
ncbi:hypothetical protein A5630_19495 [Mycolicibacterium mucogenicum]|uniref:DUF1254 domain-containing protein n=2 Tax=Mycolicibacterium mucogenicum TaxID=56689 RepID=A0A1A3H650_MYCMU|nr:hypothetical protein A5630_19495 [Mycolicibacterium mucogenicum]